MDRTRWTHPRRLLSLLLAWLLCVSCVQPALAAGETAKTVQLMKTEGTVSVTSGNGKTISQRDSMRLYNGYQVETAKASYAWFNLDDSKLSKLDEVSEMELRKSGKNLELLLNSGSLFFNVTEPLEEDETLNIRTSTMVVGIRGTCGWVRVIDRWNTQVYILEGRVECRVSDPVTGEIKSTILTGGETANFVVYPQDRQGDKCDIIRNRFAEGDIPGFVLVELVEDVDLCGQIYRDSGLDILGHLALTGGGDPSGKLPSGDAATPEAIAEAYRRLREDEAQSAQDLAAIHGQEAGQAHNISKDPVWKDETASQPSQTSGGTVNNLYLPPVMPAFPEETSATLTMPVTVPQIINVLANYNTVNIVPNTDPAQNTLSIGQDLPIPAGKTLNIRNAAPNTIDTQVINPAALTVNGTMNVAGNLTNNGSITVNSSNTLRVDGDFLNGTGGTISNTSTGRIQANIFNTGAIDNAGTVEGWIESAHGSFTMNGGSVTSSGSDYTVFADIANLTLNGGAITNNGSGTALAWGAAAEAELARVFTGDPLKTAIRAMSSSTVVTVVPAGYTARQSGSYWRLAANSEPAYDTEVREETLNVDRGLGRVSAMLTGGPEDAPVYYGNMYAYPSRNRDGSDGATLQVSAQFSQRFSESYSIEQYPGLRVAIAPFAGESFTGTPSAGIHYYNYEDRTSGTLPAAAVIDDGNIVITCSDASALVDNQGTLTVGLGGKTQDIYFYSLNSTNIIDMGAYITTNDWAKTMEFLQNPSAETYVAAVTNSEGASGYSEGTVYHVTYAGTEAAVLSEPLHLTERFPSLYITQASMTIENGGELAAEGSEQRSLSVRGGTLSVKSGGSISVSAGGALNVSCLNGMTAETGSSITNSGSLSFSASNEAEIHIAGDVFATENISSTYRNGHLHFGGTTILSGRLLMSGTAYANAGNFTIANGGMIQLDDYAQLNCSSRGYTITNSGNIYLNGADTRMRVEGTVLQNDGTISGSGRLVIVNGDVGEAYDDGRANKELSGLETPSSYRYSYFLSDPAETWDTTVFVARVDGNPPACNVSYGEVYYSARNLTGEDEMSASMLWNAPAPGYTDVAPDAWYAEAAAYCRDNGLMGGVTVNTFDPAGVMTRAMLVTVLYRAAGSPASAGTAAFPDVDGGAWYADAVCWAKEQGVVDGYANGLFGTKDPVTREQIAAILWRFAGSPIAERGEAFADAAEISPYAEAAVNWARSAGIISGVGGNRFDPRGEATRAQTAIILMNYLRGQGLSAVSAMNVMCEPTGAALLPDGSLLVTDTYNRVIWRVYNGVSEVYAGSSTVEDLYGRPLGGYNDAPLAESYFKTPWAIAPFLDGWAVSDTENGAVRLVASEITQTVNGRTKENLPVRDLGVAFDYPTGLAADGEGNLYVSDTHRNAIRKITPDGEVTTFAEDLNGPMGLCWKDGALYAAETGANRIVKIAGGVVTVIAGSGEDGLTDGPAALAAFSGPKGVAVGDDGAVYVTDTANSAVRQIKDGQVTTLAVRDVTDLDAFSPASPVGLLVRGNTLYICDQFSRKLFVLQLR